MSEDKIIDPEAIEALRSLSPDGGGEFVRELIDMYLQDTPQRLTEMDQALSAKDAPTFARAAHTIKGSSSNFGANRLSKVAQALEHQGKAGDLSQSAPLCAALKAEYHLVVQALTAIAKGA